MAAASEKKTDTIRSEFVRPPDVAETKVNKKERPQVERRRVFILNNNYVFCNKVNIVPVMMTTTTKTTTSWRTRYGRTVRKAPSDDASSPPTGPLDLTVNSAVEFRSRREINTVRPVSGRLSAYRVVHGAGKTTGYDNADGQHPSSLPAGG
ncbi:Protein CLS-1 [Anopheles sinensis]|uniref:Protein CLS-1 n=1 Tax=Anopheles sinensis TaxID=74873 RepID=A0A084W7B0_ANOSI|nr:Protein CLS-1 [Anopheles sinensis]